MIDCNADILYIKESDDLGKATLRIYECKEKTKEYLDKLTPATISKSDFDSLKNQLAHLTELLSKGGRYDDTKSKN